MTTRKLRAALEPLAHPNNARIMSSYMRNQFPFLGIKAPERKAAAKPVLAELYAQKESLHKDFVIKCFEQPEREFHYVACDYLRKAPVTPADVAWLAEITTTKSWWDTVDSLARTVGSVACAKDMRSWSRTDNLWLRRAAIIHQNWKRGDTNTALLADTISAAMGTDEFFLNKAIGWALRAYSRTDPDWVRTFVAMNLDDLAPLSVREATKRL